MADSRAIVHRTASMRQFVALSLAALLAGCASLSDEGAKVRVITGPEKQGCAYLKLVTVRASLGPDKTGQALKLALNQVAAAGGDSFYPININQDWFDGASAAGEALKCSK
jgi:hypothetical protein